MYVAMAKRRIRCQAPLWLACHRWDRTKHTEIMSFLHTIVTRWQTLKLGHILAMTKFWVCLRKDVQQLVIFRFFRQGTNALVKNRSESLTASLYVYTKTSMDATGTYPAPRRAFWLLFWCHQSQSEWRQSQEMYEQSVQLKWTTICEVIWPDIKLQFHLACNEAS